MQGRAVEAAQRRHTAGSQAIVKEIIARSRRVHIGQLVYCLLERGSAEWGMRNIIADDSAFVILHSSFKRLA